MQRTFMFWTFSLLMAGVCSAVAADDLFVVCHAGVTLAAADIQIFAVSTENRPKIMTPEWLASHQDSTLLVSNVPKSGVPAYTLYLAELGRRSGGQLYFLRDSTTLADIFRRIAQRIGAEYTLG